MNTPAHLFVGTGFFAQSDRERSYAAALLGALAPDVSLYAMVIVSIWVMGVPAETVFREYYYSDAWQAVFAVDNSFILWSGLLVVALWRDWPLTAVFAAAGLAHIALDFPLHTHDARPHFWPLSDWVFESPVSYWDSAAHAGIVGPMEFGLSFGCVLLFWRRFRHVGIRIATVLFLALELLSSGVWRVFF